MSLSLTVLFAVIVVAGVYWWLRSRSRSEVEDQEVMRIRATVGPQIHAAYARHRAEILKILKEPLLVEVEEELFNESVVWRRQFRANCTSENEKKMKDCFNNLQNLHSAWELEQPELKNLHEKVGNLREALFIVEYGTPEEVRKVMADVELQRLKPDEN